MSSDGKRVRSMYAAFGSLSRGGDVEAYVREFWDPACEYHPLEESDPIRGYDQLIRWNSRWFEVWDSIDVDLRDVVPVDGKLVTEFRLEGRAGASGLEVSQPFSHVIEMRDGRIFRMYEYESRDEALQAVRGE